ncbi:MAG: CDP-alcohol phosphatidyltransferase family protein [Propionibacteriaceae bacterium]
MTATASRGLAWSGLGAGLVGSLAAAAVVSLSGLADPTSFLGVLLYLIGAVLVAVHWRRGPLGAANLVTLGRLVGTSVVAGLLLGHLVRGPSPVAVIALAVVATACLLLDGVDGRLARSRGTTSDFGARFDVETDAALLLLLSIAVPLFGPVGWWVILAGLLRYLYVGAALLVPALRTPFPPRMSRKVISMAQNVALLAALALPVLITLPGWVVPAVLALCLTALCWSFGRDIAWQIRPH